MIILFFINRVPIEHRTEIAEEFQLLPTPDYERSDEPEANTDQAHLGRNFIRKQAITLGMTLRSCCLFPLLIYVSQEVGNDFHDLLPSWLSREYRWSLRETGYIGLGQRLLTALIVSLLPRLSKSVFSGGEMGGGVGAKIKNGNSDLGLARLWLCQHKTGSRSSLNTVVLWVACVRSSRILFMPCLNVGSGRVGREAWEAWEARSR